MERITSDLKSFLPGLGGLLELSLGLKVQDLNHGFGAAGLGIQDLRKVSVYLQ